MSQLQIEKSLNHLNSLISEGKILEGFEKYYHDDVQMQENELPPTVTKAANRLREQEFSSNTEWRKAEVKGFAVDGNVSFVIWDFDYTHKDWGVRNYTQVAVQEWKDGKIFKERFVYLN